MRTVVDPSAELQVEVLPDVCIRMEIVIPQARYSEKDNRKMANLLWTIIVLLFLFWLVGLVLSFGGPLIHLLLVAAVANERCKHLQCRRVDALQLRNIDDHSGRGFDDF